MEYIFYNDDENKSKYTYHVKNFILCFIYGTILKKKRNIYISFGKSSIPIKILSQELYYNLKVLKTQANTAIRMGKNPECYTPIYSQKLALMVSYEVDFIFAQLFFLILLTLNTHTKGQYTLNTCKNKYQKNYYKHLLSKILHVINTFC